jgi:hypothetical protein
VSESQVSAATEPLPVRTWAFSAVCATAGALAVPPHAVASPVSAVVAGFTGFIGLHVWRWSRLPSAVRTEALPVGGRLVFPAVWLGLGLIVGLLLLGVIRLVIEPAVPAIAARMVAAGTLPVWRRVLIIFVAAVGEEILFRLFLLSLVAGLAVRLFRPAGAPPGRSIVWMAIGISALAFAAVHLPAWSGAAPLTPGLLLAVLSLNALGGVFFGRVFVARGIGAAIWAHAGADCAVLLIGPLTS